MIVSLVALPAGMLLDNGGTGVTLIFAGLAEVAGCLLMAFADSETFDVFVLGYSLLAVGGALTMFAAFSGAGSLTSTDDKVAYVSACSCLSDLSVIVFQVFYGLDRIIDLSRFTLFFAYALLATIMYTLMAAGAFCSSCGACRWGSRTRRSRQEGLETSTLVDTAAKPARSTYKPGYGSLKETNTIENQNHIRTGQGRPPLPMRQHQMEETKGPQRHRQQHNRHKFREELFDDDGQRRYGKPRRQPNNAKTAISTTKITANTMFHSLSRFEFWFMLTCSSIGILRANVFIGFNPLLLDGMGDHDHQRDTYKQLFNYVLACAFVFIPAIVACARKYGLINTLQLTNALGIVAFGLALVPIIQIQMVTFVVFTAFRAFLYAIVSAYNLQIFGIYTFGKVQGLMFSMGALINLLQEPLIGWSNDVFGNQRPVCYIGIGLGFGAIALTEIARWVKIRREKCAAAAAATAASVASITQRSSSRGNDISM
eukprot:CAMPEP_0197516792 /NCGR_PEP_ID=MMETSP1318-20131121/1722_1 /TAXON_ID=552666 /ORGANISM="Partenskyella glossopodia, Strain RCC365" /LENGTH=483 /DNA_ID=CAMNT_0043065817 /DNA_START=613 /DNA_END=2062 /DNA_ORIENTATION=+